jgi:hypothetical protein
VKLVAQWVNPVVRDHFAFHYLRLALNVLGLDADLIFGFVPSSFVNTERGVAAIECLIALHGPLSVRSQLRSWDEWQGDVFQPSAVALRISRPNIEFDWFWFRKQRSGKKQDRQSEDCLFHGHAPFEVELELAGA